MLYQSLVELDHVALNVYDMKLQTAFYQDVLGLQILAQDSERVDLGVADKILVRLIKTDDQSDVNQTAGLYHLALVLPSREELSRLFRHLVLNHIPLVGGADHGYSEAIYLEDVEGNGIELYRDLPQETWDVREDGQIVGKTEPLDEEGLFYLTDFKGTYQLAAGSRLGHIHLQTSSSQGTAVFYRTILPFEDKCSVPTATWMASGTYHHHLAVNEWRGQEIFKRQEKMRGLAYFSLVFDSLVDYQKALTRAQVLGGPVQVLASSALITDEDGITFKISYATSEVAPVLLAGYILGNE